jgi:hypothetical protein
MVPALRRAFNEQFQQASYDELLADLDRRSGTHVAFRVAETPCFFPKPLIDEIVEAGSALTHQLLADPAYMAASLGAIPAAYRLPSDSAHPHFMTADFGLVRREDGSFAPRLVELQAFPSVFAFQALLGDAYREHFKMDSSLLFYLGGHTQESFWQLFRQVVVGDHDPAEVALAEIRPEEQKTLPDFLLTAKALGIPIIDATQMVATRSGGKTQLHYRRDGKLVPIRRIYNRVIVDELIQKRITLPFDYRDDLDVEWAGHPNWYFRISKFSIPYLKHPTVPEAVFLDDWLDGGGSAALHGDREGILLKPLFSFAGKGIVFAPTDEQLDAIPVPQRREYLVQERVSFAPVIETPFGSTQAEIRVLYLWPDESAAEGASPGDLAQKNLKSGVTNRPLGSPRRNTEGMEPVLTLVRLGRGKMMGVDHNRDQKWVGASAAYFVE